MKEMMGGCGEKGYAPANEPTQHGTHIEISHVTYRNESKGVKMEGGE